MGVFRPDYSLLLLADLPRGFFWSCIALVRIDMFISFWSLVSVYGLLKAEDGLVACIDDLGLLIYFGFLGFLRGERLLLRVFGAAVDFCCSKNE